MDSFFKAAVCDLDKLLDDFESVSLSTPAYPGHSLGPQGFLLETSTVPVPHSLLDLNSLHYGTAPSCPDCPSPSPGDREAKERPLTGVDLLSSVDGRGAAKSCAPPFPKRALKPVCDLVSDTGSAHLLLRANSHDAFSELDVVERRLEEELLVDFTSPVVALPEDSSAGEGLLGLDSGGYSASLSLLDVILPAAVERAPSLRNSESGETEEERDREGDAAEVAFVNQHLKITPGLQDPASVPPVAINTKKEDTPTCDIDTEAREEGEGSLEPSELAEAESSGSCTGQEPNPEDCSGGVAESRSAETELSLSYLPMGVSMCGALEASKNPEEAMGGWEGEAGLTEILEAESLSAFEVQEEVTLPENPETVGDCTNLDSAPENKPVQSPNTQSPETTTMPFHLAVSAPAVSQRPLEVSFSLVEKQPVPGAPQSPASPPSEPSPNPVDPPDFGFEYLPESDQAGLLVTDEELDAFLRGETQGQEDHGVPDCGRPGENLQDEGFSELNGNLEERLVEEELRSRGEGLEKLASPESDKTLSSEGNVSPALSAPSQDPPSPYHTAPSPCSPCSPSNLPLPYYGGARPKQLHCQSPRAPPAAGEDQGPSSVPCPGYSPPERYVSSVGYEELSEPQPYPGEPAGEGSGSSEEREAEDEDGLGCKQPPWVPDSEAPNCMNCWQKFTFTRRRHHCRACGKVYCAICCNRRCKLKYLDKEARVCVVCFVTVHRTQGLERMRSPPGPSPNPNVPSEYCSTIPPLQQARAAGTLNSPPPTVMVPVSVLKNPGSDGCPREQKRVWFADGILPNGEVANTTRLSVTGRRGSQESSPVTPDPPTVRAVSEGGVSVSVEVVRPPVSGPWDYSLLCGVGGCVERSPSLLPEDEEGLPPLLITTGEEEGGGDLLVEERPAPCQILLLLEEGGPRPLTFVLNANLLVNVKLVTYCSKKCWCLGSSGLQTVGQREIVFILEVLPEERALPKDLFTLYLSIYQDIDVEPDSNYLCGFFAVYPSTLVSVRFRETVFRETGHTIMNLLADLRNYQYSLPAVEGLRIHMEMGHSYIDIPKSSFPEMLKVVNASNEHVISVGAGFSSEADSHLVCFQNDEGTYQTQANSQPGKTRTVTGASFVVFNGALKASSGFIAKSSIVEDGLMVQIPPETMEALRAALRGQTDFHIPCGKANGGELRDNVTVRWIDWSSPVNAGLEWATRPLPKLSISLSLGLHARSHLVELQ
uniref:FYVE-type domain-containing protein n=1 Tax=Hucho hucho TaxID=62062 RepID=A0A4W5K8U3_9TELE